MTTGFGTISFIEEFHNAGGGAGRAAAARPSTSGSGAGRREGAGADVAGESGGRSAPVYCSRRRRALPCPTPPGRGGREGRREGGQRPPERAQPLRRRRRRQEGASGRRRRPGAVNPLPPLRSASPGGERARHAGVSAGQPGSGTGSGHGLRVPLQVHHHRRHRCWEIMFIVTVYRQAVSTSP
ncbi:uncharacterized protein LOC114067223 [Empidonax traillii]|uniref:uncharacterized protein LOC114067223 n=1 Tax=Empidonax traillii TaxID=164674 RepID=UPI000FFD6C32|nr:uncharacterized protein LOC114067223 [Empidonax traillii]